MTATKERTCGECKATFQGKANAKYCSEACKRRHYRNAKRDATDEPKAQGADTKKEAETRNPASEWIGRVLYRVHYPVTAKVQPSLDEVTVAAASETHAFVMWVSFAGGEWAAAIALNLSTLESTGRVRDGDRHIYYRDKAEAWKELMDLLRQFEREKAAKKAKAKRDRARWGSGSSWASYEEPAGASNEEPKASSRQKKTSSGPSGSSDSGHRDFNPRRGRAAMLLSEALQVLGLKVNYTIADAKRAYRRLAHEHHPDKGGEQVAFVRLKHAYDLAMEHAKATAGTRAG